MPRLSRPDLDRIIGQNIRIARGRTETPMSQGALAKELGCSFQQVQKYEKGQDAVAATTLLRIAEVTGQPVEFFFGGLVVGALPQAAE